MSVAGRLKLGIDTGGTFTDFVLVDEESGAIRTAKVPSTPDDPSRAIVVGARRSSGQGIGQVDRRDDDRHERGHPAQWARASSS